MGLQPEGRRGGRRRSRGQLLHELASMGLQPEGRRGGAPVGAARAKPRCASMGLQPEGRRGAVSLSRVFTGLAKLQWGSSPKAGEEGRERRASAAELLASMGLQPEGRRGDRLRALGAPDRASMGLQPEGRRGVEPIGSPSVPISALQWGSSPKAGEEHLRPLRTHPGDLRASMGLQPEGRRGAVKIERIQEDA